MWRSHNSNSFSPLSAASQVVHLVLLLLLPDALHRRRCVLWEPTATCGASLKLLKRNSNLNNFNQRRQGRPSGARSATALRPFVHLQIANRRDRQKLELETSLPPPKRLPARAAFSIRVRAIGPVPSESTSADARAYTGERLRTSWVAHTISPWQRNPWRSSA
jgi:hypothetical protein